jgi:hypothetical protein
MTRMPSCLNRLQEAGFSFEDASALRRISMTLHRWHELECGDSNDYGSWAIERGKHVAAVHYRDANPWSGRAIYVPYRRWLECVNFRAHKLVDQGISEDRIDCYLLRQPNGKMQAGLRYGVGGEAYFSPEVTDQKKADSLAVEYSEDGAPFMAYHRYSGAGKSRITRTSIPDRERGALKRLDQIMARHPGFGYHVQGDPRGCALYILRPGDLNPGDSADACYTRGIAVHK